MQELRPASPAGASQLRTAVAAMQVQNRNKFTSSSYDEIWAV